MLDANDNYYWIRDHAEKGETGTGRNLYPKQEEKLIKEGFSVKRLAPVQGYPDENFCWVDWSQAEVGTLAYEMLMLAGEFLCNK